MKWCNSDLHTLSEEARDGALWKLVVQCVVNTHEHWRWWWWWWGHCFGSSGSTG